MITNQNRAYFVKVLDCGGRNRHPWLEPVMIIHKTKGRRLRSNETRFQPVPRSH